ncbi:MAG: LapA family protein [Geovibrio sp.]|jgi:uncharacterized integral membrane protein|uniref:LapA family protein n=1 Tax=Geovibrio ferrireducens TaxID=46201 RepID=UPI00224522F1|nr:LapA family protein [Geovibrio ferrireducens]MCD8492527.1 LapA family protein [Geovibrio sp.]
MMKIISNTIKLIIIAVVVIFAVMNVQQVEVTYFFNSPAVKMPLFLVIIASMVVGLVLSSMLYFFDRIKLTGEIRKLKKKVKTGEDEIKRLRSLPFNDNSSKGI